MQSGAYGSSLAGGAFDCGSFVRQPQTILRFLSWIFSIVVFGTITSEGYTNTTTLKETHCMFNDNDHACGFGVAIGVLGFLACVAFLILDAHFPNISNANERKYIVTADLAFSGFWTFLWFICFCVLANQWSKTNPETVIADAGRAVLTFAFFSIITWALLFYFAYGRYRQGVSEFNQDYTDPAHDHTAPYPYGNNAAPAGYQQSPFSNNQGNPGEYQPPNY
ncbi:synaptogyrin-2a [Austrofundulus limnaeus]|uniref:Synaptogyrin n=1 Tax=Austrofundulus limnaeus TaxID=52670 RepID=A0A2I4BCN0_AUSLI|nr:PREDICTED: synaptogyrin-2-like [Austrofundulus limnaeus]